MKSIPLVVVSLALFCGTALAQGGKPPENPSNTAAPVPMEHKKMAAEEFAALDKNKDGKVSKDEVPADDALAAHFSMLDTDKDGSLSKTEFAKHHQM